MIKRRSNKNKQLKELEHKMFKTLWEIEPRRCEVTGAIIEKYSPWNYHHILPKSSHPSYRLYPKNILICTPEVHHKIETGTLAPEEMKWINELKDNLRSQYNYESNQNYGVHPGV